MNRGTALNSNFRELNYLIFRMIMGLNMTIHGGVRLFGDYKVFTSKMESMFEPTFIPNILITIGANLISPIEFFFGLLLLVGFRTRESIFILTLNMMLLITGVCLLQKWDLAGMQMSYVLYLFFIGHYVKYNSFSLDHIIEVRGKST